MQNPDLPNEYETGLTGEQWNSHFVFFSTNNFETSVFDSKSTGTTTSQS